MTAQLILIAIGAGLLWAGIYALSCWRWPLKDCWCCDGTGRHVRKRQTKRKVFRRCWVCRKSPGNRWRIGRRVWVFFRKRVHT